MEQYLPEVVRVVRDRLGDEVVAVALTGGAGAGSFEPESSDIDVAVVVSGAPPRPILLELAGDLSHSRRPVPARRLELVMYDRTGAVLLNVNSGAEVDLVQTSVEPSERFWFVLDAAIARGRSRTLYGAPLEEVLPEPARGAVRRAALDALEWFAREEPSAPDTVLNACRSWRWAVEGAWSTKEEAAEWALRRAADPDLIREALAARKLGRREGLDVTRVRRVAALAEAALRAG